MFKNDVTKAGKLITAGYFGITFEDNNQRMFIFYEEIEDVLSRFREERNTEIQKRKWEKDIRATGQNNEGNGFDRLWIPCDI